MRLDTSLLAAGSTREPGLWRSLVSDRHRRALLVLALCLAPLTTLRLYGVDEIEYFAYLRSAVFDHDLDFENEYRWFYERDPEAYADFAKTFLGPRTPAGHPPNNAPIGSAVLWSPFYLAAAGAEWLGVLTPSNPPGFSRADVSAVCLASMVYGVLGLFLVQEICRRFVAASSAFWATLLTWLATNLVFYLYVTPPMSHANAFFAAALFLWWWLRADERPWALFVLGILGGLLASVRWQDVLLVATPLAAPLLSGRLGDRASVRRWMLSSAIVVAGVLAAFTPQLLVWYWLNGSFTPFGVITVKGRFAFAAPHLVSIFLSPFHGLLVWTPVLAPAFAGLGLLAARDGRGRALALGVALELYLLSGYVVSFGHGFGQRLFVSALPAMTVGLAVFIAQVAPRLPRGAAALGVAAAVWWNLSLVVQHSTGMIPRNQGVSLGRLVENQLVGVPRRLPQVAARYLFARRSLYVTDPLRPREAGE